MPGFALGAELDLEHLAGLQGGFLAGQHGGAEQGFVALNSERVGAVEGGGVRST